VQDESEVGRVGTKRTGAPVFGVRSAALRTATPVSRRGPSFAQWRPDVAQLAGMALGRPLSLPGAASSEGTPSTAASAPTGFAAYSPLVDAVASQVGVDRALLAAVAEAESGFNPRAVSSVGAKGLMQLMDSTARSLGVTDAFDPRQNLLGGARFLRGLLDRYHGSVPLALAAYNAGPGAVDRYGGIPPFAETQTYVPLVMGIYKRNRNRG